MKSDSTKMPNEKSVNYSDYIQVDRLISSQTLESEKHGQPAHDEMLFIIVHQVYELWFKQILHELQSIQNHFQKPIVEDELLGLATQRLERITRIQGLLLNQISVLETMTPMDFLDFRDYLFPASGFQSFQFRMTENILGLDPKIRLKYENQSYLNRLDPKHRTLVEEASKIPSIFILLEKWLERTPFLKTTHFDFWSSYFESVDKMLSQEKKLVEKNPYLNDEARAAQFKGLEKTKSSFEILKTESHLKSAQESGEWRLSFKATQAALFICLYRDQPALQLPYRLLSLLMEIDENLTAWRNRHAQMALKMIGTKIGTGGSSGFDYLQMASKTHKIFFDLSRLATFLLPKKYLPELPKELRNKLAFHYFTESQSGSKNI
jgi:tryptophan 2,3-dioxygenase